MTANTENSILLGFIEEAQSYLPTIRQSIAQFQADAGQTSAIELAHRQVHTIRGAALMVGLPELSAKAELLESILENLANNPHELSVEDGTSLFARLDQVEIALGEAVASLTASSQENLATETMKNFAAETESETDFLAKNAEIPEDEEIDPELLEVFAMEAEDLLQNLTANLAILEKSAQNKEALSEIRRSSHTLKGAAGVVGLKTITKLAHRMEDLLDVLAEKPVLSNAETTALLISTTDVLEAFSRGQSESSLKDKLENIYSRFERIFDEINQTDTTAEVEAGEKAESSTENRQVENISPPEPETSENQSAGVEIQTSQLTTRPTVRVSVENLDSLVNLISELIINRTVMEQKISVLENQVGELQLNTNRLRRLANKLDTDYEVGSMGFGSNSMAASLMPISARTSMLSTYAPNTYHNAPEKHGFDELEFDKYNEIHQLTRELLETAGDSAIVSSELEGLLGDLDTVLTRQRRLTDEVQEKLMRVRMVSVGTLLSRLQRTVRVTAEQEGKLADFVLEGKDVELDTQVLDSIAEPLLHLLRNCVSHGIESPDERLENGKHSRGSIEMRVVQEGTSIIITITDDGRGIDPHKILEKAVKNGFITMQEADSMSEEETFALIFLPGLSTAKEVTNISGRGVGMDIVREVISRRQGTISIKSAIGEGTTFTIRLPISMAVTRALIVKAGGQNFAFPLAAVSRVISATGDDFDLMSQEKVMWVDGKLHPVSQLNQLLGLNVETDLTGSRISVLLLNSGETTTALVVDQISEATEIVLKPFNKLLAGLRGYLGATILGDGEVVPVLDPVSLLNRQSMKKAKQPEKAIPVSTVQSVRFVDRLNVMIVDDSPSVRRLMTNLIKAVGWNPIAAKDGLEALEILQVSSEMPNIILSDVEMPRMDGYELLSSLKRQAAFCNIPVVMITSRAAEKHRQKALDLGASDYVTKPYQESYLIDKIRFLMGQN